MTMTTARGASALLIALAAALPAQAQLTWNTVLRYTPGPETPVYASTLLSKGKADECFNGIGVDYPPINPDGTCNVGIPKKNQAYVWGMAQAGLGNPSFTGDAIWFGTVANPLCEGSSGIFEPEPELTVSWVCEYGQSETARRPVKPVPPAAGDYRLPRVYSYNTTTAKLTDRTPNDTNFASLAGVRSAGALGNAVLMGGPSIQHQVVFVGFDGASGAFKGSCRATALNNIRQWATVNGVLYAAAGRGAGDGVVLRWRGTVDNPFNGAGKSSDYCGFEVVGVMPGFPAHITSYDSKRLVVSVWNLNRRPPDLVAAGADASSSTQAAATAATQYQAGVYIGPLFTTAGGSYTSADATKPWVRIWTPASYETDPVTASTTGGGAIAYWQGYLWFGTIHNTIGTTEAHSTCTLPICYGPPANADEQVDLLFNVSRSASIWRAKLTTDGTAQVELLYGETQLPALVPGTKTFEMKPTGWTPRYGKSGFGNPFLTYTWTASPGGSDLLFGFYDYRYVFDVRLGIVPASTTALAARSGPGPTPATTVDPARGYGGDLWRFTGVDTPAVAETVRGFDNFTNYGVRNLLRFNGGPDLYTGMASGLNLEPAAGWELRFMKAP